MNRILRNAGNTCIACSIAAFTVLGIVSTGTIVWAMMV